MSLPGVKLWVLLYLLYCHDVAVVVVVVVVVVRIVAHVGLRLGTNEIPKHAGKKLVTSYV
jgi:hypothetical protein